MRHLITWTLERFNVLGEPCEIEYEVECVYTPGEEAYTSGPPEKCSPGSSDEFEIVDIWTKINGMRHKLDSRCWEDAGFTDHEIERMTEYVRELMAEQPEPPDRD